jgi:hypothetical protein
MMPDAHAMIHDAQLYFGLLASTKDVVICFAVICFCFRILSLLRAYAPLSTPL